MFCGLMSIAVCGELTEATEQALLGIVYSGDWLAFIKEACVRRSPAARCKN
jgi:hypothetical protein